MCYMYILRCSNGQYYVGSTYDLDKRLAEHRSGEGALFTKNIFLLNLSITNSFKELLKLIKESIKLKDGIGKRKKL